MPAEPAVYAVRLLGSALRDLKRLDRTVALRIADRLDWLGQNVADVPAQALRGELSGLFELRVGDYRVIYEPLHEERVLVVHAVGHRREVYRR